MLALRLRDHRVAHPLGARLDIVVVLLDGDPQAPHRDLRSGRGWPVELLVHGTESLAV